MEAHSEQAQIEQVQTGSLALPTLDDVPTTSIGANADNAAMLMDILRGMLAEGKITASQAKQLRTRFGITQSFFTGKRFDKEKARRKRKIAKASRRRNRYPGATRGQKNSGSFRA